MFHAMSITREDVLTVADVAALLDLKPYTVKEYARRGILPAASSAARGASSDPSWRTRSAGFRSRIVRLGRGSVGGLAIGGAEQFRDDFSWVLAARDGDPAQPRGVIAVEVDDHPHFDVRIGRKALHERRGKLLQFSVEVAGLRIVGGPG